MILTYRPGRYSLTTRSTVELQTYIANTFPNDTLRCTVCHKAVFCGIMCYSQNYEGTLRIHYYATYKRTRQTCPTCNTPRSGDSEGKLKKVGESKIGREPPSEPTRTLRARSSLLFQSKSEEPSIPKYPDHKHTQSLTPGRSTPGVAEVL